MVPTPRQWRAIRRASPELLASTMVVPNPRQWRDIQRQWRAMRRVSLKEIAKLKHRLVQLDAEYQLMKEQQAELLERIRVEVRAI